MLSSCSHWSDGS